MSTPVSSLDIVANQEAKAFTYMGLDDLGEATLPELGNFIIDRFGLGDESTFNRIGGYAVTFTAHGFAELDMKPSKHINRVVRHFRALQQDNTIPEVGAMLGWSSEHPFPLEWFMGASSSHASRAPTNSIEILKAAVDGVAISDIVCSGYAIESANNSRLKSLIDRKVVIEDDSRNVFTINDPTYRGRMVPFEQLRFEPKHVYTTLQIAKESYPDRQWKVDELLEFSLLLLPQNLRENEALKKDLLRLFSKAASAGNPLSFGKSINKIDFSTKYIEVADQYKEPVVDLVQRVERLRTSPAHRKSYRDNAFDIYEDKQTAKGLIIKGSEASPWRGSNQYKAAATSN